MESFLVCHPKHSWLEVIEIHIWVAHWPNAENRGLSLFSEKRFRHQMSLVPWTVVEVVQIWNQSFSLSGRIFFLLIWLHVFAVNRICRKCAKRPKGVVFKKEEVERWIMFLTFWTVWVSHIVLFWGILSFWTKFNFRSPEEIERQLREELRRREELREKLDKARRKIKKKKFVNKIFVRTVLNGDHLYAFFFMPNLLNFTLTQGHNSFSWNSQNFKKYFNFAKVINTGKVKDW